MKNENKVKKLMDNGFTFKTLSKMTEGQINTLYEKVIFEQIKELPSTKKYEVGAGGGILPGTEKGYTIKTDPTTRKTVAVANEEMKEEDKKSNTKNSPYAICTTTLKKEFKTSKRHLWTSKQKAKFERCVKDVKNSLKEGKNPLTLFMENEIMKIVEKHIPPRITKKDLLKFISEDTTTAPSKPKTKPKTEPTEKPKIRPSHPGKNPHPGEKTTPKAISSDKAKKEVIDAIMKILKNA